MEKALGMIETKGLVSAIVAVDNMSKSASVEILGSREIGAGLVSVFVRGDVGAVKAAIDSAASAVNKVGEIASIHIIAKPSEETLLLIPGGKKEKPQSK
jgi:ethanolamine utilization protein EutM